VPRRISGVPRRISGEPRRIRGEPRRISGEPRRIGAASPTWRCFSVKHGIGVQKIYIPRFAGGHFHVLLSLRWLVAISGLWLFSYQPARLLVCVDELVQPR